MYFTATVNRQQSGGTIVGRKRIVVGWKSKTALTIVGKDPTNHIMSKSDEKKSDDSLARVICRNRRARHEYELFDQLECGIQLHGSEVKSIRANKISIEEAYVRVKDDGVWLIGCDIAEYPQANVWNHEPNRDRKLLMHRREVRKFAEAAAQKGLTLIPLDVHFSRGLVKLNVAVAKGKKFHDKRESLKKKTDQAEMRQAVRKRV